MSTEVLLTFNAGSSSLKLGIFALEPPPRIASAASTSPSANDP